MQNILELKTINELQEFNFFVPSYQRGYRWGEKEVVELLNDINDFRPKEVDDSDDKTWYCLQPVVVKKISEKKYEVIDGQQRLTTVFLILSYLNQGLAKKRQGKLFTLEYETRKDSADFIKVLAEKIENEADVDKGESNIDFFHIYNNYQCIVDWFKKQNELKFDEFEFSTKFKQYSKIIWYESKEDDAIAIFTRINIGKIPLTNSELIKALFLNSSNFEKTNEKLRLRQLEISTEWDLIEQSFQDDRFWYFISQNKATTNRIEFIFDLMNEDSNPEDMYSTFRYFGKLFRNKNKETVDKIWSQVKKYYQKFNEWFHERELYHKIGYLVCIDAVNLRELCITSDEITKSEFMNYLDNKITDELKHIDLNDLQYSDGQDVRSVLLIYNIVTMLNSEKDNSYFPFDLYKNENWDIEHITSIKDKIPDYNREEWLKDAKVFIDTTKEDGDVLLNRIDSIDIKNEVGFKALFEDIVNHFNSDLNEEDDVNDLSNLTLLDRETNRAYKNAVFPFKRKTIINRDKQGVFIPICTKNVFLKYFSEYPPKISFWSQEDRENYERDLSAVLGRYVKQEGVYNDGK